MGAEEFFLQFLRRLPTDFNFVSHNGLHLRLRILSLHRQGLGCIAAMVIQNSVDLIDASRTRHILAAFLLLLLIWLLEHFGLGRYNLLFQ